jgi:hypothetical protein
MYRLANGKLMCNELVKEESILQLKLGKVKCFHFQVVYWFIIEITGSCDGFRCFAGVIDCHLVLSYGSHYPFNTCSFAQPIIVFQH